MRFETGTVQDMEVSFGPQIRQWEPQENSSSELLIHLLLKQHLFKHKPFLQISEAALQSCIDRLLGCHQSLEYLPQQNSVVVPISVPSSSPCQEGLGNNTTTFDMQHVLRSFNNKLISLPRRAVPEQVQCSLFKADSYWKADDFFPMKQTS